jgi:hypothetical protein
MRRKEMTSSDYHQILSQQQIEKFAPHQFDRSMISAADQEEWDDEYRHSMEPHDPVPEPEWYQIRDHGAYNRLIRLKLKRKRQGKSSRDYPVRRISDIIKPDVKKGLPKTRLDRFLKLLNRQEINYKLISRPELFNLMVKKYQQLNRIDTIKIEELQRKIKEREDLIKDLNRKFETYENAPILVETIIKNNGNGKMVIFDPDSPVEFKQAAQEADQIMQKALALYETLNRS